MTEESDSENIEFYGDYDEESQAGTVATINIEHMNVNKEVAESDKGREEGDGGVGSGGTDKARKLFFLFRMFVRSSHPFALFFHIFFKFVAVLIFLTRALFFSDFLFVLIVSVTILAVDFWVVKNVTGRLLVGLRWWNKVQEDGKTVWIFEARSSDQEHNSNDIRFFWIILNGNVLVWVVLGFFTLIQMSFMWLVIPILACILSGINAYFFALCERDGRKKLKSLATRYVSSAVARGVLSRIRGGS